MNLERRQFLFMALMSGLFPSCLRKLAGDEKTAETLCFGHGMKATKNAAGYQGVTFLSQLGLKQVPLENEIHSIAYSEKLNIKVFLPKIGKFSYYQKGANSSLVPFTPGPGMLFYGHGVFDEKRNVFYSTQSSVIDPTAQGLYVVGEIYVHSLDDFRQIGKFPSFGFNPHDLRIQQDELIVCNGGADANVSFINLETRTLVHQFKSKEGSHVSFGHLAEVDDENLLVACGTREKSRPCFLYSLNRKSGLKLFEIPQGLEFVFAGQILSVIHYKGFVLGTCPASGNLIVWNLDGKFLNVMAIPSAASLAISETFEGVVIGSGDHKRAPQLFTVKDGSYKLVSTNWAPTQTGSHSLLFKS